MYSGLQSTVVVKHQCYCSYFCRAYDHPRPMDHVVRSCVAAFVFAVHRSLKADCTKQTILRIPFRFDVFRFLFGCNRKALYLHDFDPRYFAGKWYQWHKRSSKDREDLLDLDDSESDSEPDSESDNESDGESDSMSDTSEATVDNDGDPDYNYYGHAIVFPVRVKCRLHWSPSGFTRNSDGTYSPKARTFIEMLRVQLVKKNC